MIRILAIGFGVLILVLAGGAVYLFGEIRSLDVERVSDDVHAIFGLGGNAAVLRTESGAVVVDTLTFRMQGERVRELAERLAGGPVQAIVNTHYHAEHTHGNPAFPAGTRVVATERTLDHLRERDDAYWRGEAARLLPGETFATRHEMRIGGKTIRSFHPGRGHTDGDLVTLFVEDRVLVAGDLLFGGRYPRIDLEGGGSVREWGSTLERVMDLEFDRVIPGHGPVTDRAGLRRFQAFVRELWEVVSTAAEAGMSLERTLAEVRLTQDEGFESMSIPFVLRFDRDSVVRTAWQEATGNGSPAEDAR